MIKKKNNYTPTEVNYHGGLEYGANIHSVSVQVNQYVWNMMKVLERHEMYGFDFESKIGTGKVVIVLSHEDRVLLKKAKEILKYSHEEVDFLFMTRVKRKKEDKTVWILLSIALVVTVIGLALFYLYERDLLFSFNSSESSETEVNQTFKEPIIQDIEIDVEKLKAFKESFSKEDGKPVDDKTMKVLEITTSVISSMVSEEEKEKYSTKNLVESFKGKGGIRFVAKDGNLSKDFNATVKELNGYADAFIKDENVSLALQAFDRALNIEMNSSNQDDILMTLAKQGELYEKIGEVNSSIASYTKLLKISETLSKDDFLKYGLTQASVNSKLISLNKESQEKKPIDSKRAVEKAEKLYKMVIEGLKKVSKEGRVNQVDLAFALNYLANFYETTKKEYLLSIEIRKGALEIYQKLSKKRGKKFKIKYYKTMNTLGHTYLLLKKLSLSDKSYHQGLNFAKNKLKSSHFIALSLRALAMVEIEKENFKLAENYYHDALKIYKKRLKEGAKEFVEMDGCFAYLEEKRGEVSLSERFYKKAILSYKAMNRKEPLVYNLEVANLLNKLANLYLSNNIKRMDAEIKLFEAISLAQKVKKIETQEAKAVLKKSYRTLAYLAILEENMPSAWDYYRKANRLK